MNIDLESLTAENEHNLKMALEYQQELNQLSESHALLQATAETAYAKGSRGLLECQTSKNNIFNYFPFI